MNKQITISKQEFRNMLDNNEIDLRANNICYVMNVKYEIKTLDDVNEVQLILVEE